LIWMMWYMAGKNKPQPWFISIFSVFLFTGQIVSTTLIMVNRLELTCNIRQFTEIVNVLCLKFNDLEYFNTFVLYVGISSMAYKIAPAIYGSTRDYLEYFAIHCNKEVRNRNCFQILRNM
jgi:hypothetical protein